MKTKSKNRCILRSTVLLFFPVVILFLGECGKPGTKTVNTNQVSMQNFEYTPASISVPVNTTVTWTNKDNMPHTVTSDAEVFSSDTINPGGTYSQQFTKA